MDLEVRQFKAFLAVLEHGGVHEAARRTYVAQSTMSQHIARLEAQVGQKLFERTSRGLVPTAAGLTLAPLAREIVGAVEAIGWHLEAGRPAPHDRPGWWVWTRPPSPGAPSSTS